MSKVIGKNTQLAIAFCGNINYSYHPAFIRAENDLCFCKISWNTIRDHRAFGKRVWNILIQNNAVLIAEAHIYLACGCGRLRDPVSW